MAVPKTGRRAETMAFVCSVSVLAVCYAALSVALRYSTLPTVSFAASVAATVLLVLIDCFLPLLVIALTSLYGFIFSGTSSWSGLVTHVVLLSRSVRHRVRALPLARCPPNLCTCIISDPCNRIDRSFRVPTAQLPLASWSSPRSSSSRTSSIVPFCGSAEPLAADHSHLFALASAVP